MDGMIGKSSSVVSLPTDTGLRLDRLLAARLPELSRSRLKALIEEGHVTADGATITNPSQRVKPGQHFVVEPPPPIDDRPAPQAIDLDVVYEDAELIVIDKPAGLVVHPAPGNPDATLVNALLAHCGDSLAGIGGVRRPGIVHRLDKDTSGLMVVAKTGHAHAVLSKAFADRTINRAYLALVWGLPPQREGELTGSIGRSPVNRKKMAVVTRGGKSAKTHYMVERTFGTTASLVRCRLATGRTHQIRVHLTELGTPLIGDQTYGRVRRGRTQGLSESVAAELTGFPRQALHATTLGFIHPASGEMLDFKSPIPADIAHLVTLLE
ncbi:MAG TPA: RluA family pseudouridine synthase [Stellaceae bacterium]|nr:RluA family pseudouridine synthase [Stellaceae bacterium]